MTEPSEIKKDSSSTLSKTSHVRRRVLPIIDRKFQFKVTLLFVSIITIVHLAFESYIYFHVAEYSRQLSDYVPDLMPDADKFRTLIMILMGITLTTTFVVILLVSLYFSARISGPLYNISRVLREVAQGQFHRRIHLRKNDELKEFSDVANELFDSLESREKKRQDLITQLAVTLRQKGESELVAMLEEARASKAEVAGSELS